MRRVGWRRVLAFHLALPQLAKNTAWKRRSVFSAARLEGTIVATTSFISLSEGEPDSQPHLTHVNCRTLLFACGKSVRRLKPVTNSAGELGAKEDAESWRNRPVRDTTRRIRP